MAWIPFDRKRHHTEVWWAARADAEPGLEALLDHIERERWLAYQSDDDRDRFLVGCALAKAVLAHYVRASPETIRLKRICPTCGKPHGKPVLPRSGVDLSLSHSGDIVVAAFATGGGVGVDVEAVAGAPFDVDELRRLALSDEEARAVDEMDASERRRAFFVSWTRKEAVSKAVGAGLAVPLRHVVVSSAREPPRLVGWPFVVPPDAISLFDIGSEPGYAASVAVLGGCETVREHDGSALLGGQAAKGRYQHGGDIRSSRHRTRESSSRSLGNHEPTSRAPVRVPQSGARRRS
jgi:4'-phosphopantetheinyl transferase